MNYLYNGIELPALPEWDKEKYPYAAITFRSNNGLYSLHLFPPGSTYTNISWGSGYGYFGATEGNQPVENWNNLETWGISKGELEWPELRRSQGRILCSDIVWANFDVKKNATEYYLMKSDPIPVGSAQEVEPRSFMAGLRMGQIVRSAGFMQMPVAYSYNGVVLPKLPEWDKTVYPYAYIYHFASSDGYIFYTTTTPARYNDHEDDVNDGWIADVELKEWVWYPEFTEWSERTYYGNGQFIHLPNATYSSRPLTIWCNTDMIRPDGTVDFVASDPIPVCSAPKV